MPGFSANSCSKVNPFLSATCRAPSPLRTLSYTGCSTSELWGCSIAEDDWVDGNGCCDVEISVLTAANSVYKSVNLFASAV